MKHLEPTSGTKPTDWSGVAEKSKRLVAADLSSVRALRARPGTSASTTSTTAPRSC